MIVQDGMDPGKPFTVRIEHHGVPVWQREFVTARKRRKLPLIFRSTSWPPSKPA